MEVFLFSDLVDALRLAWLPLLVFLITLFLVGLAKQDNSIIDVAWGPAFVLVLAVQFTDRLPEGTGALLFMMVAVWAGRLAASIALRQAQHDGEDARYASWRAAWTHVATRSFFQVYLPQGLLVLTISLPLLPAVRGTEPVGLLAAIGIAVWVTGLLLESVADRELRRFQAVPGNRGALLTSGLRRYSRHPNYFGEALLWVGISLVAWPTVGVFALISPLIVTYLVRFLSGVPIAERRLKKKPGFAAYARRTNRFIPFP